MENECMGFQLFCQLIKQKDLFNRAKTSKISCCLCGLFISDKQMPLPIISEWKYDFLMITCTRYLHIQAAKLSVYSVCYFV